MKYTRMAVLAAVTVSAAVGLAVPATAAPLDGTYRWLYRDGGAPDGDVTWVFSSCGPDCVRYEVPATGNVFELHRRGDVWARNWVGDGGISCSETIDDALNVVMQCAMLTRTTQLVKVG